MTSNFEELRSLFVSNPQAAIEKSQDIICSITNFDSFKEFYSYHLQHPQMSTCQKEWANEQMSIHCFDCANNPQSCICLQCFLNGNHKGHDYAIRANSTGNCDCGDLSLWKRPGFCNEHHGVEEDSQPEKYLDEKLRTALTDTIFKAAFSSLTKLQVNEDQKLSLIFQFVSSFLKFGDGFRRLITIALTEKIDFESLLQSIFEGSAAFNRLLQQLCGGLVNDYLFKCNFSRIVYKLMIEIIIPNSLKSLSNEKSTNYNVWTSFWFHSFSPKPIEYNINHNNWDWVSFLLQYSTYMKEYFALVGKVSLDFQTPNYLNEININMPYAAEIQPDQPTQRFFDELFTKVLNSGSKEAVKEGKNDTIITASFSDPLKQEYYRTPYSHKVLYYDLLKCFMLKKNLKLDKLFEEFDRSIDISTIFCLNKNTISDNSENENDKFISRFLKKVDESLISVNDYYFKSFHDGGSFFYSHPLFESLLFIFRADNMNRVKTARLLSMGKFQNLRIQLGIISLKYMLSFACFHQSLTSKNNHSLEVFLSILANNPSLISFSIPYIIPLFQLILGLQCKDNGVTDEFSVKEFFIFEMGREIGLFDNFEGNSYSHEDTESKKTQMVFSVLYISILLVIERTLFNFSGYNFIEEQLILALKQGVSQLDELNKCFDNDIDPNYKQSFNKIISNVATIHHHSTKNGSDNESSFHLKEGVEWKTISALNTLNSQKVLLNNEISKSPNTLIKIPEFEPEENYFFHPPRGWQLKTGENEINEYDIDSTGLNIRLKEILFTPTILALSYHTLRSSSENSHHKAELNDHLAMMVLVLISRFVKDMNEDSQPPFNESTVIQYDSTLIDLISKLKREIFKFNIDQQGNATIKNTINNKSFNLLLKLKIKSGDHEPKSFIDILLEKGEIGKNVLTQMSIDIDSNGAENPNSNLSQSEINKKRANKLKESIMNQYKSAISNYNINDLDQIDESPTPSSTIGETCSICSTTNANEILSYSLYIYRTKFPFIIDKPPLLRYYPQFETPIDDDFIDNIIDNKDDLNEEEDEEEEEPDLDEMLSAIRNYGIDTSDEANYQYMMLLQQAIIEQYQRRVQQFEERKIRREQKHRLREMKIMKDNQKKSVSQQILSEDEKRCTAGSNFVIQFCTCQHPVHPECVKNDVFYCPIDRSLRNGFLPAINGISKNKIFKDCNSNCNVNADSLSDNLKQSINHFVRRYSSFFLDQEIVKTDLFVELVKSISGLITTYEIRLRSLPDCLDSEKTKLLSRNLFLASWYAYRLNNKPTMKINDQSDIDVETRLTTFQKFIKRLIECDEIVSADSNADKDKIKQEFNRIISEFVNSPEFSKITDSKRKEKEIYLFLKRVCLSAYFLLDLNVSFGNEMANLIDWDEILSVSNLSEVYKVQFSSINEDGNEFEFRPFVFTKLPKEFLHFALKPFEFDVDQTHKWILYEIIDYNYLINHYNDFEDEVIDEEEELKKNKRNIHTYNCNAAQLGASLRISFNKVYPSVFLLIGQSASDIIIIDNHSLAIPGPFYVDRFKCADVGYKRGQPLFLNEERYERLIDEILSGDFSINFHH